MSVIVNTAYLIDVKKHENDNIKGFYNKSLFIISRHTENLVRAWKAGSLYDERMRALGITICIDFSSGDKEGIKRSILKVCEKNGIKIIAEGETCGLFEHESDSGGVVVYDGASTRFVYSFNEAFSNKHIDENTNAAVLLSYNINEAFLKYIADKMKYITVYSPDSAALKKADKVFYDHNSTAVVCTQNIGIIREQPCVIVLDENVYLRLRGILKAKIIIGAHQCEMPRSLMFTDKLGTIEVDASFEEAMLCNRLKKAPEESLNEISEMINTRFCF